MNLLIVSHTFNMLLFDTCTCIVWGTRWLSWFRHRATNQKVAVSIPPWGYWNVSSTESFDRIMALGSI